MTKFRRILPSCIETLGKSEIKPWLQTQNKLDVCKRLRRAWDFLRCFNVWEMGQETWDCDEILRGKEGQGNESQHMNGRRRLVGCVVMGWRESKINVANCPCCYYLYLFGDLYSKLRGQYPHFRFYRLLSFCDLYSIFGHKVTMYIFEVTYKNP